MQDALTKIKATYYKAINALKTGDMFWANRRSDLLIVFNNQLLCQGRERLGGVSKIKTTL